MVKSGRKLLTGRIAITQTYRYSFLQFNAKDFRLCVARHLLSRVRYEFCEVNAYMEMYIYLNAKEAQQVTYSFSFTLSM